MRWQNSFALSFAALILVLLLAGCATAPAQFPPIPVEALQDCLIPEVDRRTNGGLAKGVADLRASLRLCNNDKAILRAWSESESNDSSK